MKEGAPTRPGRLKRLRALKRLRVQRRHLKRALLATTRATGPSVLQVRTQDVMPEHLARRVVEVLRRHAADLAAGALVTIDDVRSRVHILPLRGR